MGVIDMGGSFLYQEMEHPWEWQLKLADRRHSGNDPRRISPQKIRLYFGAIISATIFRNRGNSPKETTICVKIKKQTPKYRSPEGQIIAPIDWGKQDTVVTNCSRHCLHAVKLRAQEWRFHGRSHHPTTSGPLESRNSSLYSKDRAINLSDSHHLCEQVEHFRIFLVRSLCDSLAAP